LENARGKLMRKNLDLVVLNSLRDEGAGFGHDTNRVTLVGRGTDPSPLPLMSKAQVAQRILDHVEALIPDA
jgi:phosphopantothenoylcysteine decarboxylase/phosphopantothenate--cysteine ligase